MQQGDQSNDRRNPQKSKRDGSTYEGRRASSNQHLAEMVPIFEDPMKQVTTLPWHFTPKGALFGPIYGIYVG